MITPDNEGNNMWRHGDVLIKPAMEIPMGAKQRPSMVLVRGELTGHSHRISQSGAAEVWEADGAMYLKVLDDIATLIHEEHKPIELPRGIYRVWQQREYTPKEIRPVRD
jgi:hypothetical protein